MNKTVKYIIRSLIILVPLRLICSAITHVANCKIESCALCGLLAFGFVIWFAICGIILLICWIVDNWNEIWSDEYED